MGLDNAYGIGSLKPGVCTSTSRPASPFEGQVIYETDTNLSRVYEDGAWATLNRGMQLITSGTNMTLDNVFTSGYRNYHVVFQCTNTVNSNVNFRFRDSTSDFTSLYTYAAMGWQTNGTTANITGGDDSKFIIGYVGNTNYLSGSFDIFSPNTSDNFKHIVGKVFGIDSTFSRTAHISFGGRCLTTTTMEGMRLYSDSGTFSGVIRLYGLAD